MNPRQLIYANALATATAFGFYVVALFIFVIFDSSDYGRADGNTFSTGLGEGLQIDPSPFVFYFTYFALYVGLATAMTRQDTVWKRVAAGIAAIICVAPLGFAALCLGFMISTGFLLGTGLAPAPGIVMGVVAALIAVPLIGRGIGRAFDSLLVGFGNWSNDNPAVAIIRQRNLLAATLCAVVAALFAIAHAMGAMPQQGLESIAVGMIEGVAGPLLHIGGTLGLLVYLRNEGGSWPAPADRRARQALGLLAGVLAGLILIEGAVTQKVSGDRLWTASGLARVFMKPGEIRRDRRPRADLSGFRDC